jgi:hypothetical protein
MKYRLGLDLGTNSLGWCVLSLDDAGVPVGIPKRALGVRIFSDGRDPQSKTSLAVDRRIARGSRRRRDRYLRRRAALLNKIVALGLMPQDKAARKALEALDPYELRARAISGPLTPHELGRALFHLHQRRGFRSNRKSDPKDEAGKIKTAISALRTAMEEAGARTIGEYLNARHSRREWVRSRLIGAGAKAAYTFYPDRSMVAAEFDAMLARSDAVSISLKFMIFISLIVVVWPRHRSFSVPLQGPKPVIEACDLAGGKLSGKVNRYDVHFPENPTGSLRFHHHALLSEYVTDKSRCLDPTIKRPLRPATFSCSSWLTRSTRLKNRHLARVRMPAEATAMQRWFCPCRFRR